MAIHQTEEQVMTDSTDLPIIMTTTSANNPTTDDNLQEILQQIIHLYKNDQILSAARLLRSIGSQYHDAIHRNDTIFRQLLQEAIIFQQLLDQSNDHHTNHTTCTRPKEDEWIKQGERHGRYNFSIFYKISKENHLTCRIETPIGADLLVPLLSVLNESELYQTWIPQYKVPKFEVVKSDKLRQIGRCGQILLVETEVQWPLGSRQLLLKAIACDDIGTASYSNNGHKSNNDEPVSNESGKILVRIQSLDDAIDKDELDGVNVPPTKKGYVRMEVHGGFVFERCPWDHPMRESAGGQEDLVLVTFSFSIDPKLRIPQTLINFFVRTAIGHLWGMFLRVAEDVKDGKRPAHSEAIESKREALYDWVQERIAAMLSQSKHVG